MNAKQKGKRGELEFVKFLKDRGFAARRSQQYKGTVDSADIEVFNLDLPLYWEVKRRETLNIHQAAEKVQREAGYNWFGIVAHRKNNTRWLCTMDASDFLTLLRRLEGE